MRLRMRLRLGPIARISMGLVSLAASLLLTADLFFGLVPDQSDIARQVRKRCAEALAVQLSALVQAQEYEILRRTLHAVISRDPEVLSIGVRSANGQVVAETGNHSGHWVAPTNNKSTLNNVLVPISSAEKKLWGQIEIAYQPTMPKSVMDWLKYPGVSLTGLLLTVGYAFFYLYLRRVLQRLDPRGAIPNRVRSAFDALSEGVLIIDRQGHVLLANNGFRALHPAAGHELTGRRIKDLSWLVKAIGEDSSQHPWNRAMNDAVAVNGETIVIAQEGGEPVKTVINCAPMLDDKEVVRGCLITFDDLSMVEHMNQALLDSVAQLEMAKRKIEQQNVELKRIAERDQLTGALTRRAFLEQAQQAFQQAVTRREELSCVMVDIDHFKAINDRYGHLVGDQAIANVAQTLQSCIRPGDILCRYGGEEFCILLPGANAAGALELAERMRSRIETACGKAVIPGENVRITSSLGIAASSAGGNTLAELIKQADQALYAAKGAGRNRAASYADLVRPSNAARVAA